MQIGRLDGALLRSKCGRSCYGKLAAAMAPRCSPLLDDIVTAAARVRVKHNDFDRGRSPLCLPAL